jgi:hypothetical protein
MAINSNPDPARAALSHAPFHGLASPRCVPGSGALIPHSAIDTLPNGTIDADIGAVSLRVRAVMDGRCTRPAI